MASLAGGWATSAPIQEDSTALVLWALWIHYSCANDIEFVGPLYKRLIVKSADFLVAHRDEDTHLPLPSFDLWEERYGTHTFTVAAVIAGLQAAASFARLFQETSRAQTYEAAADQMKDGLTEHLYHEGLHRCVRSGYRNADGYDSDDVRLHLAGETAELTLLYLYFSRESAINRAWPMSAVVRPTDMPAVFRTS